MTESKMRIKQICVYPIKSLRGCTPASHPATATGFHYDRRFMIQRVKDDKNMAIGHFLEMCLFTTELSPPENPTKILVRYTQDHTFNKTDEKVEDEKLEIPLEPNWKADGLKEREINMHSSPTIGYEMGDKYDQWFSKRFGYGVRLVYVGENRRKVLGTVSPNAKPLTVNANGKAGQGWLGSMQASVGNLVGAVTGFGGDNKENDQEEYKGIDQGIGFADVAPFLVVSARSYDDAAARLQEEKLDVHKFRPNIVIDGADEEWEEDFWAELTLGGTDARIVLTSNCARCPSVNVDFNTGKPGEGEAGKILKLLQRDRRVDPGMKYSPIFGRYGFLALKGAAGHPGEEVQIKVGDEVTVSKRNTERTRFQWPGVSTDH